MERNSKGSKDNELQGAGNCAIDNFVSECNREDVPRSTIVDKLIGMWKSGNNFSPIFGQKDEQDNAKMREAAQRCIILEQINVELQEKLISSEANYVKASSELKKAGLNKERLMNKMTIIWDYVRDLTETINYITSTLDDCKEHNDRLASDYKDVIGKIYADNESQKAQIAQLTNQIRQNGEIIQQCTQKQHDIAQLQTQYQLTQVELESYKKKVENIGKNESMLQKRIVELESENAEERKKLAIAVSSERENSSRMRQLHENDVKKLMKEIEELREKFAKLEDERNDVFRTLAGKEKEMVTVKESLNDYKWKLKEMETLYNDKFADYQCLYDEKIQFQIDIQNKDKQIAQLTDDLESCKSEISKLSAHLTNIEELKDNVEQAMVKKQVQMQEAATKYMEKEAESQKNIEQLQQNILEKNMELEQVKAELDKNLKKMEDNCAEKSLKSELSRLNLTLQSLQKANDELKHQLSLMTTHKEAETTVVQKLSIENHHLKLKFEEMERKYQNEVTMDKEKSKSYTTELNTLTRQVQELQLLNEQHSAEKVTIERELKRQTEADAQANEKLKKFENNLKTAEQKIVDLNNNNQQLNLQNKEMKQIEKKLKIAEKKAEEFQRKYYDTDAHLNERIRKLQAELDATKNQIQEANEQRFIVHQESFERNKKNLEAAEKRAQEFEEKYYAFLNDDKEKFDKMQLRLDEAEKKAQHFEKEYKEIKTQSMDVDKKITELEESLKEPQLLSPTSVNKKANVSIRSVETLLPGIGGERFIKPPPTTKKTTLKTPNTPTLSSRKMPLAWASPKSLSTAGRKTSLPRTPLSTPVPLEKNDNERPRSSSPDSSAMVDDDPFDVSIRKIINRLSQEKSRQESTPPKIGKKLFKRRGVQPK